jgi:hypothetical protein
MFPRFRWPYPGLSEARLLQIAAILCQRWMAAFAPKRSLFKSSTSRKNHYKGDTQKFHHSGNYDLNNRRHLGYILLGNM